MLNYFICNSVFFKRFVNLNFLSVDNVYNTKLKINV